MNHEIVSLAPGLYFVGVPIGTARDITLRALDTIASADVLVAEDTRSLRRLMDIHGVPLKDRKLWSLHDHSPHKVIEKCVEAIRGGRSVAYASEAGMPLIADPGFELGRAVTASGFPVTCAPGPSAVLTALVLAGLPTDAFMFQGFLPNASGARKSALSKLREIEATLVFYESPKRVSAMIRDCAEVFGNDREAAVCRELTKKFEEVRRARLGELAKQLPGETLKGEIVVLVDRLRSEKISESDIRSDLANALKAHSTRDAVDLVTEARGIPRRQVYQIALSMTKPG